MSILLKDLVGSIENKLYMSAMKFNAIANGGLANLVNLSNEHLVDAVVSQYKITLEEIEETEKALVEKDEVEIYDGYCDVFYTFKYFQSLLVYCCGKRDKETVDTVGSLIDAVDLGNRYVALLLKTVELDLSILDEYSNRVIENNMEKFTTSLDEFETWESEYIPTSKVVDGVIYYFFVDENGKVKKRDGFPKVEVEGLFNDAK